MDRKRRNMVWTSVAAAVAVALGGAWSGTLLVPERYPAVAGYAVPGMVEAPVDLASLQRSWPAGFSQAGADVRLIGYMTKVGQGAVTPPPVDTAAVVARPAQEVDLGTRHGRCRARARRGPGLQHLPQLRGERSQPDRPQSVGAGGPPDRRTCRLLLFERHGIAGGQLELRAPRQIPLRGPARAVPGNKMAFGGVRNGAERANLLAFLATLNSAPPPFPAPAPVMADAERAGR
jgi:cytochrome c